GRAVQRIDVPGGAALGLATRFFGHDAELGRAGPQGFDNGGFGFAVGLRDQIVAGLVVDHQVGAMVRVRLQDGGAGVGRRNGRVDGGCQVQGRRLGRGRIGRRHKSSVSLCGNELIAQGQIPSRGVAFSQRNTLVALVILAGNQVSAHCRNSKFMSSYVPLTPPAASLGPDGRLRSAAYGDVYHNISSALGQAEHVFLRGNGLPQRWRARPAFTVCETGFGLGLNFLALWQAWRQDGMRPRRLHMLSIEAHPFSRAELREWLERVAPDTLQNLAGQLADQWPACLPGLHRLEFEGGAVTLTLAFGRAADVAPLLRARVDAYFLDGFAPDRNPELWQPELLQDLSRLAAPDATVATWASAGMVRRGRAQAGFQVGKQPGYGGKWSMTVGVRAGPTGPMAGYEPWLQARAADDAGAGEAVVVGGGLAGAGIAQALALRGRPVCVIDASGPASAHHGHAAAALTPVIARDDNPRAGLWRAGSLRALARWAGLPAAAAPRRCGTVQLERDAGRTAALTETLRLLQFPEDWVRAVTRDGAAALARV